MMPMARVVAGAPESINQLAHSYINYLLFIVGDLSCIVTSPITINVEVYEDSLRTIQLDTPVRSVLTFGIGAPFSDLISMTMVTKGTTKAPARLPQAPPSLPRRLIGSCSSPRPPHPPRKASRASLRPLPPRRPWSGEKGGSASSLGVP